MSRSSLFLLDLHRNFACSGLVSSMMAFPASFRSVQFACPSVCLWRSIWLCVRLIEHLVCSSLSLGLWPSGCSVHLLCTDVSCQMSAEMVLYLQHRLTISFLIPPSFLPSSDTDFCPHAKGSWRTDLTSRAKTRDTLTRQTRSNFSEHKPNEKPVINEADMCRQVFI